MMMRKQEDGSETNAGSSTRSVVRACDILKCFRHAEPPLTLGDVAERTQLSRPTAYRLLKTLVSCGMLDCPGKNAYSLAAWPQKGRRYRFGYASQSEEFSFSRLVSDSIRSSAYDAGVDLLVLNNCYSPKIAIRNAEMFVREQVDLVIEFQTNQQSASVVASKLMDAGIPIIAIEIPHPGAAYYGANNYRAGLIGGHALAQACLREWNGAVDEVILLELPMAGPLPRSRLTGMLAGLREQLHKLPDQKVRFMDGNGRFEKSLEIMRRHLRRTNSRNILIGALNDPSCLGALYAFEEAGRESHCLAVGHNASIEARREMRRAGSRLAGSVGFFPERYGDAVISLALDKVKGKEIPPATFAKHRIITAANVDTFYPHDNLLADADSDSLLFSHH